LDLLVWVCVLIVRLSAALVARRRKVQILKNLDGNPDAPDPR
jgi:hypothetical protein